MDEQKEAGLKPLPAEVLGGPGREKAFLGEILDCLDKIKAMYDAQGKRLDAVAKTVGEITETIVEYSLELSSADLEDRYGSKVTPQFLEFYKEISLDDDFYGTAAKKIAEARQKWPQVRQEIVASGKDDPGEWNEEAAFEELLAPYREASQKLAPLAQELAASLQAEAAEAEQKAAEAQSDAAKENAALEKVQDEQKTEQGKPSEIDEDKPQDKEDVVDDDAMNRAIAMFIGK